MRYILALCFLFTACGKVTEVSSTGNRKVPEIIKTEGAVYLDMDELPQCSKSNLHDLAYIQTASTYYVCDGQTWVEIYIRSKELNHSSSIL